MGQYHNIYNLDKREFISAHDIDNGAKLMEQCGNWEKTTSDAVWLLLANNNGRGSSDARPHPMIGRWAGDRLVVQGDYAEATDVGYISEKECELFTNISSDVKKMLNLVFSRKGKAS